MSEISGIIRNSIERGWAIDEVRTSLFNAGYNIQEVDLEIREYLAPKQSQIKPVVQSTSAIQAPLGTLTQSGVKYDPQSLQNYQTPVVEKHASKKIVILIIVLLIICFAAGAALFLFG